MGYERKTINKPSMLLYECFDTSSTCVYIYIFPFEKNFSSCLVYGIKIDLDSKDFLRYFHFILKCLLWFYLYKYCEFIHRSIPLDLAEAMEEFDNLPKSIEEFFTAKEFSELSEYEKLRCTNLRINYEFLSRNGKKIVSFCLILFDPCNIKLILN